MYLYYSRSSNHNVGDDLNPYLWPHFFGADAFDDGMDRVFVGIGSVLEPRLNKRNVLRIVFGSGARSARTVPDIRRGDWDIGFVRGPRTARALGADIPYISDPAILTPSLWKTNPGPRSGIGYVPYFVGPDHAGPRIADALDAVLIRPSLPPDQFVAALSRCEYVISESLHGAILADAYRIPWIGCHNYGLVNDCETALFKWGDWLDSLGLPDRVRIPVPRAAGHLTSSILGAIISRLQGRVIDQLSAAIRAGDWQLSQQATLERAQDRMVGCIDLYRRRYFDH